MAGNISRRGLHTEKEHRRPEKDWEEKYVLSTGHWMYNCLERVALTRSSKTAVVYCKGVDQKRLLKVITTEKALDGARCTLTNGALSSKRLRRNVLGWMAGSRVVCVCVKETDVVEEGKVWLRVAWVTLCSPFFCALENYRLPSLASNSN
jgi:hypothetical protein